MAPPTPDQFWHAQYLIKNPYAILIYELARNDSNSICKGKIALSFGSYGWSGEAIKIIDNQLKLLKLNVFREGLAEKFYPHNGKQDNFIELGKEFGLKMLEEYDS